jgi:adenylate cyclase
VQGVVVTPHSVWKTFNRFVPWGLPALLGLAWALGSLEFVKALEWRSLDWRTKYRVQSQPPPDPRVRLVLFDDDTYVNMVTWPPSREFHGNLVELLSLAGVSVVTFDVILDARRTDGGDESMGQSVMNSLARGTRTVSGSVTSKVKVLGEGEAEPGPTGALANFEGDIRKLTGDESALLPFPELREVSYYGFVDQPRDAIDGILREPPLVLRVGNAVYPSLGLQTLMAHFKVNPEAVRVRLGDAVYLPTKEAGELRIPVSESGRFLLNYRYEIDAEHSNFPVDGYRKLILGLYGTYVEPSPDTPKPPDLKGAILFVGQYITGNPDAGPTPRSSMSPLPLIHANLVDNVLKGDYARRVAPWMAWLGVALLMWTGWWCCARRSLLVMIGFAVFSVAAYVVLAFALWSRFSLWLPLVTPVAGIMLVQFWAFTRRVLAEQRAKEQIRGTFNAYLAPELLTRVMSKGGLQAIESERKPVTIMFSDLRDFTSWSERTHEQVLIAQLNEYLSAMVECIHVNGGTLHKFIGDAVMAVWGDLVSEGSAADAERACRAALAMQKRLEELNAEWTARGQATLRMGIGLNHGTVLAGNIGSPRRMEFTVIGDSVNLASRLEGLNKDLRTSVLVGASVQALVADRFVFKEMGDVAVKGKSLPIVVFELTGGEIP